MWQRRPMPSEIEIGRSIGTEYQIQLDPVLKNYISYFAEKRDEASGHPETSVEVYPEAL